jgi:hypothetical protein
MEETHGSRQWLQPDVSKKADFWNTGSLNFGDVRDPEDVHILMPLTLNIFVVFSGPAAA